MPGLGWTRGIRGRSPGASGVGGIEGIPGRGQGRAEAGARGPDRSASQAPASTHVREPVREERAEQGAEGEDGRLKKYGRQLESGRDPRPRQGSEGATYESPR